MSTREIRPGWEGVYDQQWEDDYIDDGVQFFRGALVGLALGGIFWIPVLTWMFWVVP